MSLNKKKNIKEKYIFECVMAHFVNISFKDFKKYHKYFSHVLILKNNNVITVVKSTCFNVINEYDNIYCDKYIVDEHKIQYMKKN